ncbi:MAG TPA: cell division protein FtsQ [Chryseosolibacter sp.]|jgi:cell division protein FtsQ|nr:cell division protein FtsQ [Chryseosolibacter sp.]
MKFRINIGREIRILAIIAVLFALIGFTERITDDATVRTVQVRLENVHENHYLDENDIFRLMDLDLEQLKGADLSKVNFSEVEHRIRESPYVDEAELFSDLKGNLTVKVSLRRPIARMVWNNGPDAYIAEDGTIMPVSQKFTSRVLVISGDFVPSLLKVSNILEMEEGRELMAMLNTIHEDTFWNAQIAQIDLDATARATLFAQVGDERIEFGKPDDLDVKFRKLKIFYKEILPRVGWNKYDRINVEYEGQVVAE